jgi:hypothetical protein
MANIPVSLLIDNLLKSTTTTTTTTAQALTNLGAATLASPNFTGSVSCTGTLSVQVTGSNDAINGHSPMGLGINGTSTDVNSVAVNGDSDNGTGLAATTAAGTYHATFGYTGINQSFVARLKGSFGWIRGSFTGRIHAPDTLTANTTYTLPDASGTVPVVPAYADLTAANIALDAGDCWWDTTSKKLRTATA